CSPTTTVTTPPTLVPKITQQLLVGTYCVQLSDSGGLTSDMDFDIRITLSFNPPTIGSAGTEIFASNVYPSGTSTRTFPASATGQITVRLTQLTPAVSLGFGLGVPGGNEDCSLFKGVITQPGVVPEISAPAEAGSYCVKLWDTGQLTGRTQFQVQITHP